MKKLSFVTSVSLVVSLFSISPAVADPIEIVAPLDSVCLQEGAIVGTEGDDVLEGTDGDDVICGGLGNDVITGSNGNDTIIGGAGNDEIQGGAGDDLLEGSVGDDVLSGGSGADDLWGGDGADDLTGDGEADYISGGPGADNLFGGSGPDTLLAGLGNDGLQGGEDADWLDGQGGTDTCAKETGDVVKKCFYDKKGPFISQIAVDPTTSVIDVSDSPKVVTIRFVLNDPGSGAQSADLWFEPKATRRYGQGNEFYTFSVNTSVLCSDLLRWQPNSTPTNCRLSGNESRGVYTASATIRGNARKGSWTFSGGVFKDKALNQTEWDYKTIDSRKLAVSFSQAGNPDKSAPAITSLQIVGSHKFATADSTLRMSVGFSDPNGLGLLSIHYNRMFDVTYYGGRTDPPACDDSVEFTGVCLRSGSWQNGVIEFPVRLNTTIYPAVYLNAAELEVQDTLENARNSEIKSSGTLAALRLVKSFVTPKPVDDKDTKAPTITGLTFSRKKIDTAGSEQAFNIVVTAKDTGVGLNFVEPTINFSFKFEGESIPLDLPVGLATAKGTPNSATYTFQVTVPAHFRQGNIILDAVHIEDASQRENYTEYGPAAFTARRWPSTVRNG